MMDTGLARPPSPTYTAITPVTRAPERNAPAAKTELPREATVSPADEGSDGQRAANNARDQKNQADPVTPRLERRNIIDPDSESLVYVATNTDTGQIVRQIPSETLLRLRAYSRTMEESQPSQTGKPVQLVV
ncbi:hypothetical protein [Labrenzia sp. 011]|uniref:hypothetical protein n=1 Tax=Labrenzia sp. 011 TaxID=2171494 RepID=UPI000D50D108|nr:hypothetical protein [Labrenzia sp. 011]PVB59285.1 hypothetical protein DCO57_23125 [Labrenzia sp. 011]